VALLVAMDHNGTVPAQWQIADKSNEIPAFAPLLDTFDDLDGGVITADALHTQHGHGTYMRRRGDYYVAIVTTAGRIGGLWDSVVKGRWVRIRISRSNSRADYETIGVMEIGLDRRMCDCPIRESARGVLDDGGHGHCAGTGTAAEVGPDLNLQPVLGLDGVDPWGAGRDHRGHVLVIGVEAVERPLPGRRNIQLVVRGRVAVLVHEHFETRVPPQLIRRGGVT
jgi:predicted transposase YbfD/YdcC